MSRLHGMSLREKCAQMVFARFRFDAPEYERTVARVRKDGIGGVCLYGGSRFDVGPFVNSLQRVARRPVLVAAELEDGAGQQVSGATVFPTGVAVGAAGSEEHARDKGRFTALEARALGITWVLAPRVDADDPVRSFGADPEAAVRLGRAFIQGLEAGGALGCLRLFPGKGGGTEQRPFRELAAECAALMTGHHRVEAIDADAPASLSAGAGRLIRESLGFQGLVVTDALDDEAVTSFCGPAEAVHRAVAAGADVLLCPEDAGRTVSVLETLVGSGRIAEEAVDRAAGRILDAKDRLGLFGERVSDQAAVERVVGSEAHRRAAQRLADAAVTRVRGNGRLPERVAYRGPEGPFKEELERRGMLDEAAAARVVVVGSGGEEGASGGDFLVSFGPPGRIGSFPEAKEVVCAYGDDEFSQRAAARALAGEIGYGGTLPVPPG